MPHLNFYRLKPQNVSSPPSHIVRYYGITLWCCWCWCTSQKWPHVRPLMMSLQGGGKWGSRKSPAVGRWVYSDVQISKMSLRRNNLKNCEEKNKLKNCGKEACVMIYVKCKIEPSTYSWMRQVKERKFTNCIINK
jgi:hypothetical protein